MATAATRTHASALASLVKNRASYDELDEAADRLLVSLAVEPHDTWWTVPNGTDTQWFDSFDEALAAAKASGAEHVIEHVGDDNGAFALYDATWVVANEDWE